MIEQLFINILEITLTVSPILLLLFLLSQHISRSYSAKWSYFVWLLLAFRLVIPFHISLPDAPVAIQVPARMSQPIAGIQPASTASQAVIQSSAALSSASPAPAASVSAGFSLLQIVSVIWICGIVLFLCFHFAGYFLFLHKAKRWRHSVTNPTVLTIFAQKQKEVHIKRNISLYRYSGIHSPMLVGFFKPMILIPDCSVTGEQLGIILAHELIHYKRRDLWYQLLLIIANAVHWFNPFVYRMVRQADNDLELFCDEEVVQNQPPEFRKSYGEAIFVFLKKRTKNQTSFSTNFLGGSKAMKQRFARIFDQKKKRHGFAAMATVLGATVLIGTCVACTAKPESLQTNVSSQPVSSASEPANSAAKSDSVSSANPQATSEKSNQPSQAAESKNATASQPVSIAQKTKDYLLNGQNNKSEAQKLQWSETFLNQVNIDRVYQKYLSAGGKANDVQSFAEYLTKNAPVANNWKTLFEADLLKAYGEKPARYEALQDNLYRVYVKKDGAEVPYVTVNARTGYFHG